MNHPINNCNSTTWHPTTQAIRTGTTRSQHNEHCDALYLTSSFTFDSAEQAQRRFSEEEPGNVYSRFTNPNTTALAARLSALEQAQYGVVTASGMSAITILCLSHLSAGDHILSARELFGTSISLFRDFLPRFGITTTFVPLTDYAAWQQNLRPNTRLLFCETPSNPLVEVANIPLLADIAHKNSCLLAIDNCMATPALQRPMSWGADIVIHSATKYLDGGGKCLGGAVLTNDPDLYKKLFSTLRCTGATMSPFNAWLLLKSLETLHIRMQQHSDNAQKIAEWLHQQPFVKKVYYPSFFSTQQQQLIKTQQTGNGGIVSFTLQGQREAAWQLIDNCQLFSRTANFGDARSTICHPATTTHHRVDPAMRETLGITEGLVRLSVGLENPCDLIRDLTPTNPC